MGITIPHYHFNLAGNGMIRYASLESNLNGSQSSDRRIALLDRDGVLIEKVPAHQYILAPKQIKLIKGMHEAIHYLNEQRIPVVLITNQAGIAKKQMTEEDFYATNARLQELLGAYAIIDAVFFCPHQERELCRCRKPKPGMLEAAIKEYRVSKERAIMFGDTFRDIKAAENAGIKAAYIATKHDEYEVNKSKIQGEFPDVFLERNYPTLLEAVKDLFR